MFKDTISLVSVESSPLSSCDESSEEEQKDEKNAAVAEEKDSSDDDESGEEKTIDKNAVASTEKDDDESSESEKSDEARERITREKSVENFCAMITSQYVSRFEEGDYEREKSFLSHLIPKMLPSLQMNRNL